MKKEYQATKSGIKQKIVRLNLRVTVEQRDKLKRIAAEKNITVSELIRQLISNLITTANNNR